MMKHELEKLVGRSFTVEQYSVFEKLYMESDMDKQTFAKSIKRLAKSLPDKTNKPVLVMSISDNSGHFKTPNGCWYHTVKVELVDVSIKTGKMKVKKIPNTYEQTYGFDISEANPAVEVIGA